MTKVYDVVATSKMAAENVGAYNNVEYVANTGNIEQGRICTLDHANEKVVYAAAISNDDLWLSASVEKFYSGNESLTEFINEAGKKMRALKIVQGDQFLTSAHADVSTLTIGDDLMLEAGTGMFITSTAAEAVTFEVVEITTQGGIDSFVVRML